MNLKFNGTNRFLRFELVIIVFGFIVIRRIMMILEAFQKTHRIDSQNYPLKLLWEPIRIDYVYTAV